MKNNYTLKSFNTKIFNTRKELGVVAASDLEIIIADLLKEKESINMIFAAAPSQFDLLENICKSTTIDFSRINAFHMDEYIGIDSEAPQGFANFLKRELFSKVQFKSVHFIDCTATDANAECERYEKLLIENKPDIVCLGIGENGHIAFNDPDVADFNDDKLVKVVTLDDMCRQQQVNDGCFESIDKVPQLAMTLTIPALVNAKYHLCVVPAKTKAQAVYNTIHGEINTSCPSTILRLCSDMILYLDSDSSSLL